MELILKKLLKVYKYRVIMGIEVEQKRKEVIIWLQAIKEAGEFGKDPIKYFKDKLFVGSPKTDQFVRNILNELVLNGFLKDDYSLNKKGSEALEKKKIFLPQKGPYEISVINDPIFEQVILHYIEVEARLYRWIKQSKEEMTEPKGICSIPKYITALNEKDDLRVFYKKGEIKTLKISEVDSKGYEIKEELDAIPATITINDKHEASLKIFYLNEERSLELPKDFNVSKVIEDVFKKISTEADLTKYRIPVSFNKTTNIERKKFRKNFNLKDREILNLGIFESIQLKEAAIFPKDDESASNWAKELILDKINTYCTREEFSSLVEAVIGREELRDYKLEGIEMTELLERIPFAKDEFWFLKAPQDLKLEQVIK